MKVQIQPLLGSQISDVIAAAGDDLGKKEIDILNLCQMLSAETWSGYIDGDLICCWGLIPPTLMSQQVYLWMHCTPEVREHQFLLVRHSQKVIEQVLERYPTIVGDCLTSASDSIRWLRWLGAEFDVPQGNCRPFVIRAKHG